MVKKKTNTPSKAKMLINAVDSEEFRIAVIKEGEFEGFHIETSSAEQKIGNIYKAIVDGTKNSLQACFINYGTEKNGFLPLSEIHPEYYIEESLGDSPAPIDKLVEKGQPMLVQVTKEMPGKKGAHLTTYISLAGRYLVLTPGRVTCGVSKKIESEEERHRLKGIMGEFKLPEGIGYIVRTAAEGQNKREISKDLNSLLRMWKGIRERVTDAPAPSLIHKEQDMILRTLRDYFSSDISEILVDDRETYEKVVEYMKIVSPRNSGIVKLHKGDIPILESFGIEEGLDAIYAREVPLKSGGSIVIDVTEALIAIDVNSGRGGAGRSGVEATAYKTNLEAAVEIARQLRLRDIGGLVVIDFIDMRDRDHIKEIEKVVREESKKDRAKIDVAPISKFGLLELSRQRIRPSIESKSYVPCRACRGRGIVKSVESSAVSILRHISTGLSKHEVPAVIGHIPLEVANYLQNKKRKELAKLEERYGTAITMKACPEMPQGEEKLEFVEEAPAHDLHPGADPHE